MKITDLLEAGTTRGSLDYTSSRSSQDPGIPKDAQGRAFCEGPVYDKLPHNFATLLPCPHSLQQVEQIISSAQMRGMDSVDSAFTAYKTAVWGTDL